MLLYSHDHSGVIPGGARQRTRGHATLKTPMDPGSTPPPPQFGQSFSLFYFHHLKIFPRCLPPEWDPVWVWDSDLADTSTTEALEGFGFGMDCAQFSL